MAASRRCASTKSSRRRAACTRRPPTANPAGLCRGARVSCCLHLLYFSHLTTSHHVIQAVRYIQGPRTLSLNDLVIHQAVTILTQQSKFVARLACKATNLRSSIVLLLNTYLPGFRASQNLLWCFIRGQRLSLQCSFTASVCRESWQEFAFAKHERIFGALFRFVDECLLIIDSRFVDNAFLCSLELLHGRGLHEAEVSGLDGGGSVLGQARGTGSRAGVFLNSHPDVVSVTFCHQNASTKTLSSQDLQARILSSKVSL